jgi:hypothetical protein
VGNPPKWPKFPGRPMKAPKLPKGLSQLKGPGKADIDFKRIAFGGTRTLSESLLADLYNWIPFVGSIQALSNVIRVVKGEGEPLRAYVYAIDAYPVLNILIPANTIFFFVDKRDRGNHLFAKPNPRKLPIKGRVRSPRAPQADVSVGNPNTAMLTPEEDSAWNHAWEYYVNQGYDDNTAGQMAWKDIQQQFPRLREYQGARPEVPNPTDPTYRVYYDLSLSEANRTLNMLNKPLTDENRNILAGVLEGTMNIDVEHNMDVPQDYMNTFMEPEGTPFTGSVTPEILKPGDRRIYVDVYESNILEALDKLNRRRSKTNIYHFVEALKGSATTMIEGDMQNAETLKYRWDPSYTHIDHGSTFDVWAYETKESWEYGEVGGDANFQTKDINNARDWARKKIMEQGYHAIEVIDHDTKKDVTSWDKDDFKSNPSARRLPIVDYGGKQYFVDSRLNEMRNVEVPWDTIRPIPAEFVPGMYKRYCPGCGSELVNDLCPIHDRSNPGHHVLEESAVNVWECPQCSSSIQMTYEPDECPECNYSGDFSIKNSSKKYSITYFDPTTPKGDENTWYFDSYEDAEAFQEHLSEMWRTPKKEIQIDDLKDNPASDHSKKMAKKIAKSERNKGRRARVMPVAGGRYGVFIDGKRELRVRIPKIPKKYKKKAKPRGKSPKKAKAKPKKKPAKKKPKYKVKKADIIPTKEGGYVAVPKETEVVKEIKKELKAPGEEISKSELAKLISQELQKL